MSWREMVQEPISKLDDDAFTRVRILLMNALELEALDFSHAFARMSGELRDTLAQLRRVEQHQAITVNGLLGADHSPLEIAIAYEQVAIEVTAAVAQAEPDEYLAQVYRFGLLENLDHLYRYAAMLDRLEGKDANSILQCYTDILPGRPTVLAHRHPLDDLRTPFDSQTADIGSRLRALTVMAAAQQTRHYYMHAGPLFSDPLARQLCAEIASIEEQHLTQYESIIDPSQTWLEQWVMHEATEAYNYYGCVQQESNPRIKALWERFLDYELGHFHVACAAFKEQARRDPAEIVAGPLPEPIAFASQRDFVRQTLANEVDLRADRAQFVPNGETAESRAYREAVNREGSPSQAVAAGYIWTPGTELAARRVA
jgi:hypothetical protein